MSDFQHSYALVIGINDYSNGISSLKTAVSDAKKIAHLLETKHHYTVTLLLDRAATLSQLRQVLETELPKQIQAGDRFLFYFAGHGIALNGEDGPEGYLIPQNAKFGNVSTYLPMSKVNKALLQLPCRHFLGILDCCFAGAFRWSSTRKAIPIELGTIHKERYDRFIQDPAWQVLTSAAYDQSAWDAFDLKDDRGQKGVHSPFACALIEALEGKADAFPPAEPGKPAGDGVITASELYLYLRDRVEIATEARAIRQTPGIHCLNKHDKGEYIFLTPGHALNLPPAPPLDVSKNPYRGLSPFEEEHCDLFFGRNALTQKLYEFVTSHTLTVVLGASGSGKSSLVKAGLIPKLRQCKDGNTWFILPPFRPGESPFKALNNALASVNLPAICATQQHFAIATPSDATSSGLLTLAESLANWFKEHPKANLLLVVDQFEELITLCRDDQERQQFLETLAKAIATYPSQLHLVLTLRSDFEPQFRNTALEKDWQTARFVVPAMTREELRQAIEEPASARVMYFDPHELVEHLIDEVANMPGALPLLSFALSELYLKYLKRQENAKNRGETIDRAITQADYEELGGVTRSLTQRADQEYEALVKQNSAYAQTIQHVMLRMVAVSDELARRRVLMSELEYPEPENQRVQEVRQRFWAARLLVSAQDVEGRPYLEPAHDALVRGWQRLLEWTKHEQEYLILQRQLTPAAEEWKHQQKGNFLWNSNPRLDLLNQVLKSPNSWFNQAEAEFVRRSVNQRRRNIRFRWGLAASAFLVLSSFTAAIYIQLQQTELREKGARAEILLTTNPVNGLALAIQAIGQNRFRMPWNIQDAVESSLLKAVQTSRERSQFVQEHRTIEAISLSPNGKAVATVSGGFASLWSLEGKLLAEFPQKSDELCDAITFSPDGNAIVGTSVLMPQAVKLWDLSGNAISLPFQQTSSRITTVTYSRDGKRIVSGSEDGKIRVWERQGKPLTPAFGGQGGRITALAFSQDGSLIASAGEDKQIRLWTSTGKALGALPQGHKALIKAITFSSDGLKMLTKGIGDEIFLWHLQKNTWVGALFEEENFSGFTISATLTTDSQGIISGNRDGSIKLWNLDAKLNKNLVTQLLPAHSNAVSGVALSSDDKLFVSADEAGEVKTWDFQAAENLTTQFLPSPNPDRGSSGILISPNGRKIAIEEYRGRDAVITFRAVKDAQIEQAIVGFKQPLQKSKIGKIRDLGVNLLAFSADAQQIIVGSADGIIRLWDIHGTPRSVTIGGGSQGIYEAALSPNGQQIVTGGTENNIRLWNLQGQMLNEQPLKHSNATVRITFSPDGKKVVAGDIAEACIWNLQRDTLVKLSCKSIPNGSATAFSPNSKMLIVGDRAGSLHLWNVETNQIQQSFQAHQGLVTSIAFSSDGNKVVSGSEDGSIQLSTIQGNLLGLPLQGQNKFVTSVAFSSDGKTVVSTKLDGSIKVYQASWEGWLKVGCDRLRNHPIFREPQTREYKEAKKTCQKYVWSSE